MSQIKNRETNDFLCISQIKKADLAEADKSLEENFSPYIFDPEKYKDVLKG